jgi:hypothetical protein
LWRYIKQVEQVAAERRATTSKLALSRRLHVEKKRAETLAAGLQQFQSARDREGLLVARVAAGWQAKTAATAASAADAEAAAAEESEAEIQLKESQQRVVGIHRHCPPLRRMLFITHFSRV